MKLHFKFLIFLMIFLSSSQISTWEINLKIYSENDTFQDCKSVKIEIPDNQNNITVKELKEKLSNQKYYADEIYVRVKNSLSTIPIEILSNETSIFSNWHDIYEEVYFYQNTHWLYSYISSITYSLINKCIIS